MRMYYEKDPNLETLKTKAKVALDVCERKIKDLDDIIDEKVKNYNNR